jgi:hypothetical protein
MGTPYIKKLISSMYIVASSLAILFIVGSIFPSVLTGINAIPAPTVKGNVTLGPSPTQDQVLVHLKKAADSVKNSNNTNAIIEVIKAVSIDHDLIKSNGATIGSENQTISKRNMGAMSNETTGLNLTSLFK